MSDKSSPPSWSLEKRNIHSFLFSNSSQHLTFIFPPSNLPWLLLRTVSPLPLAVISCTGRRRSPSVTAAASTCSWKTCLSLHCHQLVCRHLTRWINARHTCLLITTYFQFQSCQAQYSAASFPGSRIAELIQNPLPDIYNAAQSVSHIYHVQALFICLGEKDTVVSAAQ